MRMSGCRRGRRPDTRDCAPGPKRAQMETADGTTLFCVPRAAANLRTSSSRTSLLRSALSQNSGIPTMGLPSASTASAGVVEGDGRSVRGCFHKPFVQAKMVKCLPGGSEGSEAHPRYRQPGARRPPCRSQGRSASRRAAGRGPRTSSQGRGAPPAGMTQDQTVKTWPGETRGECFKLRGTAGGTAEGCLMHGPCTRRRSAMLCTCRARHAGFPPCLWPVAQLPAAELSVAAWSGWRQRIWRAP